MLRLGDDDSGAVVLVVVHGGDSHLFLKGSLLFSSVADAGDDDDNDNCCDGSSNCSSNGSTIALGIVTIAGIVVRRGIVRVIFWAVALEVTATVDTVCLVAISHVYIIIKID